MDKDQAINTMRGISIVNLILGLWLIVSPYLFSYTSSTTVNSVVLGIIVAALAIVRLVAPSQVWASWTNGIAGLWLIIAPFIIGASIAAEYWNGIIVGIVVAVLGFWNASIGTPVRTATTTHRHV